MIENSISTTRIGGDGGEMTRRSRLEGVEEKLAKETEEGSHRHHPEEKEINLVVNTDRQTDRRYWCRDC